MMRPTPSFHMSTAAIVYVVEDDPGALKSLLFLIESAGLTGMGFLSPVAFLEHLDANRHLTGCLVTDFRMPQMTGLQLFRELAARNSSLPVIMVTAFGDVATCAQALREGMHDFLEKPYPEDILLQRIQQALAQSAADSRRRLDRQAFAHQLDRLTPREREVMDRLLIGKVMKEIATEFQTSVQTISKQRQKLFDKLGVTNEVQLLRLVLDHLESPSTSA
jgi:FixJ family two-component response regulator